MAPRLSGQNSIFGVVFFVSKSLLGIERQKKLEKFAILTRKPRSHARILIYRTWPINNKQGANVERLKRRVTAKLWVVVTVNKEALYNNVTIIKKLSDEITKLIVRLSDCSVIGP